MMPQRTAIGTTAIALGIVAVVIIATIGVLAITSTPSQSTNHFSSSMSTITFCGGSPCGGNRTAGSSQSGVSTATTCVTTTQENQQTVSCASPSITSTGTNIICSVTGQPGGAFLRILSDSTQAPVIGAVVTATLNPVGCMLNGIVYTNPATTQTFTTNGTTWILLNTTNGRSINFTVMYSGQSYTFAAPLRPVSLTCTTLYVPSGRANSTATFAKSTCP